MIMVALYHTRVPFCKYYSHIHLAFFDIFLHFDQLKSK